MLRGACTNVDTVQVAALKPVVAGQGAPWSDRGEASVPLALRVQGLAKQVEEGSPKRMVPRPVASRQIKDDRVRQARLAGGTRE